MKTKQITLTALLWIVGMALIFTSVQAQDDTDSKQNAASIQKTTIKGLIVGRDGDDLIIKGETGNVNVTLSDTTKIKVVKGLLGIRRETMGMYALIPGLRVVVDAETVGDKTFATFIKFKADDMETANMIQAGLQPTQQQVQSNKQKIDADSEAMSKRFGDLSDFDVKGQATVLFAINSSTISAKGKSDLKKLSADAKKLKKFIIQVAGYTDSSGKADYNQKLSDSRAAAVVAYLRQSCGVPMTRVLSPAAMGMSQPVASNETSKGKAENRRVEVKVLVNKGTAQQ
jgi:OmpA-OmpF porin, OOP family